MSATPHWVDALAEALLASCCRHPHEASDGGRAVAPSAAGNVVVIDCTMALENAPVEMAELFADFSKNLPVLEDAYARRLAARSRSSAGYACGQTQQQQLPVRLRFAHVPGCLGSALPSISMLRHHRVGKFVTVSGLVTRVGAARAAESVKTPTFLDGQRHQASHGVGESLVAKPLKPSSCELRDVQELRLQATADAADSKGHGHATSASGLGHRSIGIVMFEDLVGQFSPGDRIVVGGLARAHWRDVAPGSRVEMELFVEANHVRRVGRESDWKKSSIDSQRDVAAQMRSFWKRHEDDEFRGRALLVSDFAPTLHGLEAVKLAVLLALVGGGGGQGDTAAATSASVDARRPSQQYWRRFEASPDEVPAEESSAQEAVQAAPRSHGRSSSHLFLVGASGTGKSELLRTAADLSERSILVNGKRCTRSGLTGGCVREAQNGWALEAGALAMADGGACCVDDFGGLPAEDRVPLHEAMEQQTISVNKPGLACSLRSRCTVIAAQTVSGVAALEACRCPC
eukprot:TRINITY_DN39573_c0_g1_i2.p1 TRINITY_DN39573_c0_g1~~TRINITY_DN39573_c0_g1_i2.p1  ORF type:complete len:517 (-),score=101.32 TRINITY_DN39573_c0_g1_i2:1083-2633(-)